MGRKDWPDDWRVGNDSARVGLGCLLAVILPILAALVWSWVQR